jgi:hypothetical protein
MLTVENYPHSGMAMSGQITLGGNGDPPSMGYGANYVVALAPAEEHATEGTGTVALRYANAGSSLLIDIVGLF